MIRQLLCDAAITLGLWSVVALAAPPDVTTQFNVIECPGGVCPPNPQSTWLPMWKFLGYLQYPDAAAGEGHLADLSRKDHPLASLPLPITETRQKSVKKAK